MFPQDGNGFPGTNFGNQCSDEAYEGPGYNGANSPGNNHLMKCPKLAQDLQACRSSSPGKKILLSLGGGTGTYNLNGAADGTNFASLLWNMFGAGQKEGIPRPFDYNNVAFSVDGFDFDIEYPATDNSEGYKALVTELRRLFGTASSSSVSAAGSNSTTSNSSYSTGNYYLTASPQCVVPDANLKDMLSVSRWDMMFIQFYNTPFCSARTWADANPTGSAFTDAGFTFDAWATWLAGTPSSGAKLFIGMPGSADAANAGNDLSVEQVGSLAAAFRCRASFGGFAVWEATHAAANVANGKNFYQNAKAVLAAAEGTACPATKRRSVRVRSLPGGRRWEF